MTKTKIIFILLRTGVAFPLLYAASIAFSNPLVWESFLPGFTSSFAINEISLIYFFGLVDLAIGLWILSGRHIFIPSLLASAFVFIILVSNLNQFSVVFRDVTVLFVSVALTVWSYKSNFLKKFN